MVFLIDFENISNSGLTGLDQLDGNDQVLLFYSEMANKISIDLHLQLEKSLAHREYFCVKTGSKNALDFQLATHLGYLIANDPHQEYAIVTKDEGFNALVRFWEERDCHVRRCVNLCIKPAPKAKEKPLAKEKVVVKDKAIAKDKAVAKEKAEPSIAEQLEACLPNDLEKIPQVEEVINQYKTRQNINNALVKVFGADAAYLLYKDIKPLLKKKKK